MADNTVNVLNDEVVVKSGKASTRAKMKYNEKAYDRVYVCVKKGRKALYVQMAERKGKALNKFVCDMLEHCLEREKQYAEYETLAAREGLSLDELTLQLLSAHFDR